MKGFPWRVFHHHILIGGEITMTKADHRTGPVAVRCFGCGQRFVTFESAEIADSSPVELLSMHLIHSKGCCRDYAELGQVVACFDRDVLPDTLHVRLTPRGYEVCGITWPQEQLQTLGVFPFARGEKTVARHRAEDLIAAAKNPRRELPSEVPT